MSQQSQQVHFMARLARIIMLPTSAQVENALIYHIGRPIAEFNRAMAEGSKPLAVGSGKGFKNPQKTSFSFEFTDIANSTIRALWLYVEKPPSSGQLDCACGETGDTVYIAIAPPVLPEIWQLYIVDMGLDDSSNVHRGLSSMIAGLTEFIVEKLRQLKQKRFNTGVADKQNPATWAIPVNLVGYGFGGALAQVLAVKLQKMASVAVQLHVTTFGSPSVGRKGIGARLMSVLRFAHANDPIARLMPSSLEYVHLGAPLEDETLVEYVPASEQSERSELTLCTAMGCHTAYSQVDFRDKKVMEFYSKVPLAIALLMLPNLGEYNVEQLWRSAYRDSRLLTAEGSVPCPWTMVLGKKEKQT